MAKAAQTTVAGDAADDPAQRIQRAAEADEDARRVHHAHMHCGSVGERFQALLDRMGGGKGETVLCDLACKGIVNVTSLGNDLVGDCRIVLTEVRREERTFRRIYLYQVGSAASLSRSLSR